MRTPPAAWPALFVVLATVQSPFDAMAILPAGPAQATPAGPEASPSLRVRVLDVSGAALPCEAFLVDDASGAPVSRRWSRSGDDGWVLVEERDPHAMRRAGTEVGRTTGKHRVIVRGPFGWLDERVELGGDTIQRELVAPRSTELRIILEGPTGTAIPTGLAPLLYTDATALAAWQRNVQQRGSLESAGVGVSPASDAALDPFNLAPMRRVDDGAAGAEDVASTATFAATVPTGVGDLWVLIDHPGFLRAGRVGPLRVSDEPIRITLPAPCALDVTVAPDDGWPNDYAAVRVEQVITVEELHRDFVIGAWQADGLAAEWTAKDLPPGMMRLDAYALAGAPTSDGASDALRGGRRVVASPSRMTVLSPAATATRRIALRSWDEANARERLLKGDQELALRVVGADGGPIVGSSVRLAAWLPEFKREVVLHEGTLSSAGSVRASSLPTGDTAAVRLYLDGALTEELALEADHGPSHTRTVKLVPVVGRQAPEIVVTRLDNGEPISLSSLRGKVVLLDFWATWCGPCQQPMAHNDAVLRRRADWRDRAIILGASIDNSIDQIRGHVARKGWTAVTQAFCGGAATAWKSSQAARYGVKGIPAAFLIDRAGVLRWAGHPSALNIEQEIDRLLAEPAPTG